MNPGLTGRRYGPEAWLLTFGKQADAPTFRRGLALLRRLEEHPPADLLELVPSFTTILCRFVPGAAPSAPRWWAPWDAPQGGGAVPAENRRRVEIPVRYDGGDLQEVAVHHGLGVSEVIRRHVAGDYFVHCLGFTPGFPYLGGLDPTLHLPRRATPRTAVPTGSVAIGGEHTGIYTISSPGGWWLLGRTSLRLFDPHATGDDRFLLRTGDAVRFVETMDDTGVESPATVGEEPFPPCLTVLSSGTGLTVQDLGRAGWARFGVPPGGAMDPSALAGANRLVDNPPHAPALELLSGRQELRAEVDVILGLAGADLRAEHLPCGGITARVIEPGRTVSMRVGDRLRFRGACRGVWAYLAVCGGVAAPVLFGSASATPRAGLGLSFTAGSVVVAPHASAFRLPHGTAARRLPWDPNLRPMTETVVRVWPGPQLNDFAPGVVRCWFTTEWHVSSQSDRAGYRLEGESLPAPATDLISEPVLPGSVQVPAGGQPIVTMPDGPTMGGYPKVALVDPSDLGLLAQSPPGSRVRFVPMPNSGWPNGVGAR